MLLDCTTEMNPDVFFLYPPEAFRHMENISSSLLFSRLNNHSCLISSSPKPTTHLCVLSLDNRSMFSLSLFACLAQPTAICKSALISLYCLGPRLQQHWVKIKLLKAYIGPTLLHQRRSDPCPPGLCNRAVDYPTAKTPPLLSLPTGKAWDEHCREIFLPGLSFLFPVSCQVWLDHFSEKKRCINMHK